MVAAASPPPAPLPHAAPGCAHPTYTKMIKHALTELGGCSARPAIAGYILDRFSGFPASHDALLSAHLRRLLAEGFLRTDGAEPPSYIFASPEERRRPGRPRKDPTPAVDGEKGRGPGRPRKSPQGSSENAHTPLLPAKRKRGLSPTPATEDDDDPVTKRGPGRPTTEEIRAEAARTFQNGGVQSGGASSSAGAKRGRGRPRKENPLAAPVAMSLEPGTPLSSTKRGRGRPRKHKPPEAAANSPTTGAAASRGFKRGCGRPSMDRASAAAVSAQASMEKLAATAAAMYAETGDGVASTGGQSRMEKLAAAVAAMSGEGIKRGRGRPRKEKPSPVAGGGGQSRMEKLAAAVAAMSGEGIKRGRGRPRMEKPSPVAGGGGQSRMEKLAAMSGEGIKRGRGRPRKEKPSPVAGGGGQSRMEKLAAAVAAMSGEGIKRGRGRPRKEKPSPVAGAGMKRSRGRAGKDQSIRAGLVESVYQAFFRDMMAEASVRLEEEDSVSGEKTTQAEMGVATGEGKETRTAAGRVPVSGENAASAPAPAGATDLDLDPANPADDAASTGIKRPRGRPRKNKLSAAADDGVSTGVKRGRGRPRTEKLEEAMSAETGDAAPPTGIKRGRGRPRKERLEEGMSAETRDAAPTVVKRGRGRPRKKNRGGGRPRKDQSSGTGFAAGEALFRDMAEALGDIGEDRD